MNIQEYLTFTITLLNKLHEVIDNKPNKTPNNPIILFFINVPPIFSSVAICFLEVLYT